MTSAPRVNQIRFLSSVAFENAERLMLAASCSAADAMDLFPGPKRAYSNLLRRDPVAAPYSSSAVLRFGRRLRFSGSAAGSSGLASRTTLPPAASTALTAASEAPATSIVIG